MKKNLITGLIVLLPLALTVWIIFSVVNWLTAPFLGIAEKVINWMGLSGTPLFFLGADEVLLIITKILILLFLFACVTFLGAIGRYVAFKYIIKLSDAILHKLPVISSVYKTSQELIHTILSNERGAFKQVVLVPFPNKDCLSIGLVTKEDHISPDLVPVFVPTTPNPTSGYLIIFQRSQAIPLNMSVEEAFRYILSCGALLSDKKLIEKSWDEVKR
jgi:uncharacterized membrane protein